MQCKTCGKEIAGEQVRLVAEWPFCVPCFESLLAKPKQEEPCSASAAADASGPAAMATPAAAGGDMVSAAGPACHFCGKPLLDGAREQLGPWTFCPACFEGLSYQPRVQLGQPEVRSPPPPADDEDQQVGPARRFRIRFGKTIRCQGCGRQIPEGGSRMAAGFPYCPECYKTLPKDRDGVPVVDTPAPAGPPGQPSSAPGESVEERQALAQLAAKRWRCESCERALGQDLLAEVEGFFLCKACRSTDPELALHIARGRHAQRMQRIRNGQGE